MPKFPHIPFDELFDIANRVAGAYKGEPAAQVIIRTPSGREVSLTVPPLLPDDRPRAEPEPAAGGLTHDPDWRIVTHPALGEFRLSRLRGEVVRVLWESRLRGEAGMREERICREAGATSSTLHDLFRVKAGERNPLGTLIVAVGHGGMYRIAPLPGERADEGEGEGE